MQKASSIEIQNESPKKETNDSFELVALPLEIIVIAFFFFLALMIMIYKAYKGSNILGVSLGFLFVCYSWPRLFLKKVLFLGRGTHAYLIGLPKAVSRR